MLWVSPTERNPRCPRVAHSESPRSRPGTQVAVYVPGVRRPLYGVVVKAWRERQRGIRVIATTYWNNQKRNVEYGIEQIDLW